MPWTEITRAHYQRVGLRYASDMTDQEWALIERRLPPRRRLGRPREVRLRRVVEAILFILSTGSQRRARPTGGAPPLPCQGCFYSLLDLAWWVSAIAATLRGRCPRDRR